MLKSNILRRFAVKTFMRNATLSLAAIAAKVEETLAAAFLPNETVTVTATDTAGKARPLPNGRYLITAGDGTTLETDFASLQRTTPVTSDDILAFLHAATRPTAFGRILIEDALEKITRPDFGTRAYESAAASQTSLSGTVFAAPRTRGRAPRVPRGEDGQTTQDPSSAAHRSAVPVTPFDVAALSSLKVANLTNAQCQLLLKMYMFCKSFKDDLGITGDLSLEALAAALQEDEYDMPAVAAAHSALVKFIRAEIKARKERFYEAVAFIVARFGAPETPEPDKASTEDEKDAAAQEEKAESGEEDKAAAAEEEETTEVAAAVQGLAEEQKAQSELPDVADDKPEGETEKDEGAAEAAAASEEAAEESVEPEESDGWKAGVAALLRTFAKRFKEARVFQLLPAINRRPTEEEQATGEPTITDADVSILDLRLSLIAFLIDLATYTEELRLIVTAKQAALRSEKQRYEQLVQWRRKKNTAPPEEYARLSEELRNYPEWCLTHPLKINLGRFRTLPLFLIDRRVVLKDGDRFCVLSRSHVEHILRELNIRTKYEKNVACNLKACIDLLYK